MTHQKAYILLRLIYILLWLPSLIIDCGVKSMSKAEEFKKYQDRLNLATARQTRRYMLTKGQSAAILEEICPFCEFVNKCRDYINDDGTYMVCLGKSGDINKTWLYIGDDRSSAKIGDIYGMLTIIDYGDYDIAGRPRWLCRCECGNEKVVLGLHLIAGNTRTCGKEACKKEIAVRDAAESGGIVQEKPKVVSGSKYGLLTAVEQVESDARYNARWLCVCECGTNKVVLGYNLLRGFTQSCGNPICRAKTSVVRNLIIVNEDKEVRGRKYKRGAFTDPNGMTHVHPNPFSSKVGCTVDVLKEARDEEDPYDPAKNYRYYVNDTCEECNALIRFDAKGDKICTECSLIQ